MSLIELSWTAKNIHTLHPYVHNHLLQVSQDNSGQKQTPTKTNRHQSTPTDGPRQPKMLFKDAWRLLLTSNGICWCLLVSFGVRRRLSVSYGVWRFEEGVWGASERVSVCCLWTCLRFGFDRGSIWVFRPCLVQLALYWKIFERQNSTHLAFLKQQNTKTSLYKLSKNHRVITLLENFGSVRRNLQSTVSLDHPVDHQNFWSIVLDNIWSKKIYRPKMIVWWQLLYSPQMILL
jgi:hypothetical protein